MIEIEPDVLGRYAGALITLLFAAFHSRRGLASLASPLGWQCQCSRGIWPQKVSELQVLDGRSDIPCAGRQDGSDGGRRDVVKLLFVCDRPNQGLQERLCYRVESIMSPFSTFERCRGRTKNEKKRGL